MAEEDLLRELCSLLSPSERSNIFKLLMNHCGNKEKVAARLLNKRVQAMYCYTTGSGRKKPLVPNTETTGQIAGLLLNSDKSEEQILLLAIFKTMVERVSKVLIRHEKWLLTRWETLPEWKVMSDYKTYKILPRKIEMKKLEICAICGFTAIFPQTVEINGKKETVCTDCYEDKYGLILPKKSSSPI